MESIDDRRPPPAGQKGERNVAIAPRVFFDSRYHRRVCAEIREQIAREIPQLLNVVVIIVRHIQECAESMFQHLSAAEFSSDHVEIPREFRALLE